RRSAVAVLPGPSSLRRTESSSPFPPRSLDRSRASSGHQRRPKEILSLRSLLLLELKRSLQLLRDNCCSAASTLPCARTLTGRAHEGAGEMGLVCEPDSDRDLG